MDRSYFIGIDIGTQGARVVLLDDQGIQISAAEESFTLNDHSRQEQSPEVWWKACKNLLKKIVSEQKSLPAENRIIALSVTSTSGTIIALDKNDQPLSNAIMYSDQRSASEAVICARAAKEAGSTGFSAFNSSCGLPKMLWFLNQDDSHFEKVGRFIHACDFIIGNLSGNYKITDYTNALKSGYDVHEMEWPSYIFNGLPFKREWFPEVTASGTPIGKISPELARETGLSGDVLISSGMTDGCASQVASGAVNPGDWNTTIGTTLVIKGVTEKEINDPAGAIYCHRHPDNYWMPGGASNTGADWISRLFGNKDLNLLNEAAAKTIPGNNLAWPLFQQGERFPFVAAHARGFVAEGLSDVELYTAYMEGVAYIERYAFERIRALSGENIKCVYTAGGGSNSDTWLKIRANVLKIPVAKMQNVSGAAGAAILAASKTFYNNLGEAAKAMTRPEKKVVPDEYLTEEYSKRYNLFLQVLKEKGYIS